MVIKTALVKKITTRLISRQKVAKKSPISRQKVAKNTYNKPIKRMTFIDYQTFDGFCFVRLIGLEPTRPGSPDPKSGASTNFATSARNVGAKVILFD